MKSYGVRFGSANPATYTGLSPTFTLFFDLSTGATLSPPGVTEIFAASGFYQFQFDPTLAIGFVIDGGAAVTANDRYIVGTLDPIQSVDEKVGTTLSSYGDINTDPGTVIGYVKRIVEWLEGDAVFTKSTGIWNVYPRGITTTVLGTKELDNNVTEATKF